MKTLSEKEDSGRTTMLRGPSGLEGDQTEARKEK